MLAERWGFDESAVLYWNQIYCKHRETQLFALRRSGVMVNIRNLHERLFKREIEDFSIVY